MCLFACMSLCDSGQGDNRLISRGDRVRWGCLGETQGGRGRGGGIEGQVVGEGVEGVEGKGITG